MSITLIRDQIDRFLASETPEVIAIKGPWGVGKTFAWKKYVEEAGREKRIALKSYAYVSLFGLNSLDELKLSIFMEIVNKNNIGILKENSTFAAIDKSISSLSRKALQLFKGIPYAKDLWPTIQTVSFSSLKETIICIDDFERKGKGLDAGDIMGLVSLLKEEKSCKIALIFNEQSFEETAANEYKKYREKVVDVELLFNPTPGECATIALTNDSIGKKLQMWIERLEINNIRVIRKIDCLARKMVPILSGIEDELVNQALQSLTLFTWCFHNTMPNVPDYDFLKRFRFEFLDSENKGKEESDDEKIWKTILKRYEYLETDEFDLQIAKMIEQGYVDEERFISEANKLNNPLLASKSLNSFAKAWDAFHDTFEDNAKEFIEGIVDSFTANAKHVSLTNLNSAVQLFRELGENGRADLLIEIYIDANREKLAKFSVDDYPFRDQVRDETILRKLAEANNIGKRKRTLQEVLLKIAGKDSWSNDDEEILANASIEDYHKLFKSEKGPHLSSWIDTCLGFGKFSNPSERMKQIASNASEALRMIGEESTFNSLRVRKYGILQKPKKPETEA